MSEKWQNKDILNLCPFYNNDMSQRKEKIMTEPFPEQ